MGVVVATHELDHTAGWLRKDHAPMTQRRFASLALLLLSTAVAMGQVATGSYSYGTFNTKGIDTINVGNLNVHVAIPVLQKLGRKMLLSYVLGYDS
jgi:hypothetical protein